jgi:hypothetical protein
LPHQAQEATLSFVKAPAKDQDYGVEALEHLQQLAGVSHTFGTLILFFFGRCVFKQGFYQFR